MLLRSIKSLCLSKIYLFGLPTSVPLYKDFPVAQTVKNLPSMQETRARSLCREDPLEKGMAIHSSILAWRIPWAEEPGGITKNWIRLSN